MSEQQAEVAISVRNVFKSFKLPHEQHSSIKSALINFGRRRGYEKQQVLDDVSFEIEKGDFFAIVGRNGSGKSTLLKLLAGIYSPDSGSIDINGKLTPFIELGVGFNPELTGRENVFLNGALLGFNRKEMEAMYDDVVAFAELERFMDQKLKNYSSGMQVRLAFAIAIRARSDILLLDEVLAVGDAAFQQKCYDYFEELKRRKQTVVFVSHDMSAVMRFCNKAVHVKAGKIDHYGTPSEIADVYLEENIEGAQQKTAKGKDDSEPVSKAYKINGKISNQTDESLTLNLNFSAESDEELYIGIAVLRDGISVAEINTVDQLKLSRGGDVTYTLDVSKFNGGAYQIGYGLFRLRNKELIAAGKTKASFVVKRNDPTKGAALRLESTWRKDGAK